MGKENVRTLKNVNYNAKKSSKKSSKKTKHYRSKRDDPSTSDEMRDILASDSEVMPPGVKGLLGNSNMGKMNRMVPFEG
jgi:hypothetical protein